MNRETTFTAAFTRALRGGACSVVGLDPGPAAVPTARWTADADDDDREILDLCHGPTLDIGCGPGRMAEELAVRGQVVLGIDVVAEAVHQTIRRGASALRRDVFGTVPAEGRWHTALLADGNIGIGGDPEALLRRTGALLTERGRIVVEVAEPGVPARAVWAMLECEGQRSRPFRWAVVGTDDIGRLAAPAGFGLDLLRRIGQRWCAVLVREPA
ncbi:class I SAM-dependent methyltransferase [Nocardioides sp. GY 10113]|uniref:methyltransferase domain-containing protein n=1 Tax=Nocardioides sp. GY 10113 TaxID=2569761 RepID=UPI0010A76AB3|nr:class I SAM-dependent methyltransferase [Nocardioides sp. GY 10113]TIC80655.1 class I SAM-dependent methyltransferase [Nocardioides sp. GY 10113]